MCYNPQNIPLVDKFQISLVSSTPPMKPGLASITPNPVLFVGIIHLLFGVPFASGASVVFRPQVSWFVNIEL